MGLIRDTVAFFVWRVTYISVIMECVFIRWFQWNEVGYFWWILFRCLNLKFPFRSCKYTVNFYICSRWLCTNNWRIIRLLCDRWKLWTFFFSMINTSSHCVFVCVIILPNDIIVNIFSFCLMSTLFLCCEFVLNIPFIDATHQFIRNIGSSIYRIWIDRVLLWIFLSKHFESGFNMPATHSMINRPFGIFSHSIRVEQPLFTFDFFVRHRTFQAPIKLAKYFGCTSTFIAHSYATPCRTVSHQFPVKNWKPVTL